ncbi:hypothetical protein Slala03_81130 [Streptomyces lavendulae subsp. lavendulae]|nr:hypothetical protein Slala03_81130 [Streptomyces lavendulae subsp. lavendulae]
MRMPLTTEEQKAVHAALVSAGADRWAGGQPCTFHSLLARWADEVAGVEEGYSWCAPELANDIWCRTALAHVWPLLPPRVQSAWQPRLHELDGRFRAATVQWPGRGGDEGHWWKWRIPRLLEAEAGDPCKGGWPSGWEMMPFPKPDSVQVVV